MTTNADPPEVLWDEDGEHAWALGHLDADRFIDAVVASLRHLWEDETAAELVDHHRQAMMRRVEHLWLRDLGPDIERMERCAPTDEGATAMTYVSRADVLCRCCNPVDRSVHDHMACEHPCCPQDDRDDEG